MRAVTEKMRLTMPVSAQDMEPRVDNTAFLSGSSVWSVLPEGAKPETLMPAIPDRPVALTAMTDAAATAAAVASYDSRMIGSSPYYNSGYSAASYGMYGSSAQNYYPVSSSLRGSTAPFPFAATPQAYYVATAGNSYSPSGFDYNPYPAAVQCYGSRSSYYGNAVNPVSSTSSLYAMSSLPSDSGTAIQLSPFSSKSDVKKTSKGAKKKKVSGGSSSPDGHYTRIFIWEMEDVCVLSNLCLRAGDPVRGQRLAHTVNANVDRLIASAFGFDQNDECDHVNIEDASIEDGLSDVGYPQAGSEASANSAPTASAALLGQPIGRGGVDWMRKLAAKYQHVKDTYTLYKNNYPGFIEETGINAERAELHAFKTTMDPITQAWTDSVARCLKIIVERSSREHYANVLLTSESIVCTLAKLLVMEQSSMIPAENVYSTAKTGKESVIERILSRFGKKCSFVIISTRSDTHEIAKKENIPLWKLKNVHDLDLFYTALTHHLLN
ncbi:Eyes absent -like protein 4 [Toxocara canis]|uniref:Eyes absent homolog n=1 Tax=Toxocara canis TaxID=6265 RepID=A0A0B2V8B4_TOXCA|nr:Eyes absent -like protein 4 [Toxocara canis]